MKADREVQRSLQRSIRSSLRVASREVVELERTLSRGRQACGKLKQVGANAEVLEMEAKRVETILNETKESKRLLIQMIARVASKQL